MEMKRLGTILSGLCLLFALSVSSVAVAGPCDTCAKCDQDGDTYFDTTSMCIRKCDSDLNRQDPDDADPDDPAIPVVGCPVGGGTVTKYTVTLKEDVKGVSVFEGWSTSKSGNK